MSSHYREYFGQVETFHCSSGETEIHGHKRKAITVVLHKCHSAPVVSNVELRDIGVRSGILLNEDPTRSRTHRGLAWSFSSIPNALVILTFEPERKVLTLKRWYEVSASLNVTTPMLSCRWAQWRKSSSSANPGIGTEGNVRKFTTR